jgi:hypothetical protein
MKDENNVNALKIEIYVDSSFNDPNLENKSRSGYLIFVNEKKQSIE